MCPVGAQHPEYVKNSLNSVAKKKVQFERVRGPEQAFFQRGHADGQPGARQYVLHADPQRCESAPQGPASPRPCPPARLSAQTREADEPPRVWGTGPRARAVGEGSAAAPAGGSVGGPRTTKQPRGPATPLAEIQAAPLPAAWPRTARARRAPGCVRSVRWRKADPVLSPMYVNPKNQTKMTTSSPTRGQGGGYSGWGRGTGSPPRSEQGASRESRAASAETEVGRAVQHE